MTDDKLKQTQKAIADTARRRRIKAKQARKEQQAKKPGKK